MSRSQIDEMRKFFSGQDMIKRPPTCHEILDRLKEHYEECEGYLNKLIEANADWLMVKDASTRVNTVNECINIVKSVMEGQV